MLRRLEAVLNSDQVDAGLLDLLAPALTYNGQPLAAGTLVAVRAPLWAAVPDLHWQLDDVLTEGTAIASRWTIRGTHLADFPHPVLNTAPATGQTLRVPYMLFCRIEQGRIVAVWDLVDRLTLFQQVRILPNLGLGDLVPTRAEAS